MPVGAHITDFVSFPLRVVIDVVPAAEQEMAQKARADKRVWLAERGYQVIDVAADEAERDLAAVLDRLAREIADRLPT